MKKIILALSILSVIFVISCKKVEYQSETSNILDRDNFKISANVGADTKVSIDGISVSWKDDDIIYLAEMGSDVYTRLLTFYIDPESITEDGKSADFYGASDEDYLIEGSSYFAITSVCYLFDDMPSYIYVSPAASVYDGDETDYDDWLMTTPIFTASGEDDIIDLYFEHRQSMLSLEVELDTPFDEEWEICGIGFDTDSPYYSLSGVVFNEMGELVAPTVSGTSSSAGFAIPISSGEKTVINVPLLCGDDFAAPESDIPVTLTLKPSGSTYDYLSYDDYAKYEATLPAREIEAGKVYTKELEFSLVSGASYSSLYRSSFYNSIYNAQQNPHIAERVFILYWDQVSRMESGNYLSILSGSDSWNTDYFSSTYLSGWISYAHTAVQTAQYGIDSGVEVEEAAAIKELSRIWRAYLYSEMADGFGPTSIDGIWENSTEFSSVEDVYHFMLDELSDAVESIDVNYLLGDDAVASDIFYAGNLSSWVKFANSLRLRYAMRLQGVSPTYAQAQFEAAASDLSKLISEEGDIASVEESGAWHPTTGVMTRSWDTQPLSLTMANLTMGIGGVSLSDISAIWGTAAYGLTEDVIAQYSKDPSAYLGVRMPDMLSTNTNIDNAGYLMDYMPKYVDPRALVNYSIPGHNDGVVGSWNPYGTTANMFMSSDADADILNIRAQYSWVGLRCGEGGVKSALLSGFTGDYSNVPIKSAKLRDNTNSRVFFGPWETYFLLAEAAIYGWSVPMSAQASYEAGIKSSFDYQGVGALADAYIASEAYNMIGTSASFTHTAEITYRSMLYVDLATNLVDYGGGIKGISGTPTYSPVEYQFPTGLYSTNNDVLTKIITQKYIAQVPWLPNEAWSDYRRLGLPFMENPLLENPISTMPNYTDYTKADINNIAQRIAYPSSFATGNAAGYSASVALLGGVDDYSTPLWWSKAATGK